MNGDPARLELSPEEMRALGRHAVDTLVDHWTSMRSAPAAVVPEVAPLRAALREPLPEEPGDWREALAFADRHVFGAMGRIAHPRFLAFVPGPSNFVGAVADALVSGHNAAASLWREGAGPAECELTTLEWVKRLTGLEDHADGVFASGGSVANMIGLAAARNDRLGEDTADAAVYCADQTHSCVARALRVLGFRADRLRTIATGDDCRLDPGRLRAAIERDRRAGSRPFCVVANAGTTNTGAVDDLHAVADLADEFGLWLHVDGAYGAAAALVPEGRALLAGMERADSVVIDPHKWLFQPYEAGVCLVREPGLLNRAFASAPEYLQDVAEGDGEVNFSERGLQLSRGLRAFKLWLSLKVFGADAFRQAVRRGLETAERAAAMLRETGRFEIVTGPALAVVTFRFLRDGLGEAATNALQRRIVEAMLRDGFAFVTSTELKGRVCLRFCTINPRIVDDDLSGVIERIVRFGDAAPVDG